MGLRRRHGAPVHGWLPLHKESGISSNQALQRLLRLTGAAKGGHGGTLDPFAEGVLPVALGEATKTVSFVLAGDKQYRFWLQFGAETDTDDRTGAVTVQGGPLPGRVGIEQVLPQFVGVIEQQVPVYSAVHIDGERAYRLARRGAVVDMPVREVRIDRLSLLDYDDESGVACLEVACGSGTYVRALARAIGRAVGCPGHLQRLLRTSALGFELAQAHSLDRIEQQVQQGRVGELLLPVDCVLEGLPAVRLSPEAWEQVRNGREVRWAPDALGVADGNKIRLMTPDGVFAALATWVDQVDQNGSGVIVPNRLFNL
ncbi:MAG: tRNA pseudouridine(55) synthase TruB [Magnetococcales bacterium]|nr:tRNA pseudouridine(55) synthase TruB [Magnetococcales bacterium]